ncbi:hypothetical protein [Pedobacter antarcticus]|uniref:hypothetical protein n=1 Tax=Pedobacter antarcticus TaxID=34086 RepID=UPI001C568CFF|nr:hypothetical protein [Pedobacter antarcticus]
MKKNYYLLFLLITAATLFSSCKKNDFEYENDYDKSFRAWTDFKANSSNSYQYVVSTVSWTGYRTETKITIVNGEVTERSYTAKTYSGGSASHEVTVHQQWTEDKSNLNTHKDAAESLTLDVIYDRAKVLLQGKKKANSTFEAKNNGMISVFGFSADNCQDDCFSGTNITSIERFTPTKP